jgi:UDP-galactopyranose mutase
MKEVLIVGAGLSGAVLARELAEAGIPVQVIDARSHVGGNCHTERDPGTGVMVHAYGPHIFHTSDERVWRYLQRFGTWAPFVNRVKAHTGQGVFSLPINLHTLNQFFGKRMTPGEARVFLAGLAEQGIGEPANFEEQALKTVGRELYEAFFKGYTTKQWGCDPDRLQPEILKRLPVRFDYNDSYYDDLHQAIPREGYTQVVENILDHPLVKTDLGTPWDQAMRKGAGHVFFSGALDQFFGFSEGALGYRTLDWQRHTSDGDFQGNAVINYTQLEVPWTRVLEHKHFAPWESHGRTVVFKEFSREAGPGDPQFYPKRFEADRRLLDRYLQRARREPKVSFLGRLGTYRYLDMHQVVSEALVFAQAWLKARSADETFPVFSGPPR